MADERVLFSRRHEDGPASFCTRCFAHVWDTIEGRTAHVRWHETVRDLDRRLDLHKEAIDELRFRMDKVEWRQDLQAAPSELLLDDKLRLALWLHAEAVWQRDQTLAGDAPELQRATDLVAELRKHVDSLAKVNELQRAELAALKAKISSIEPTNRSFARADDPETTRYMEGWDDCRTVVRAFLSAGQPDTEATTEQAEPKKRAETTCASGPTAENPATTPRGVTPAPTTSPREPWRTTTGAATALATQSPTDPTDQGAEAAEQAVRSQLKVGDRVEFSPLKPEWRGGTVAGVAPLRVRADDADNLTTEPAAVRLVPAEGRPCPSTHTVDDQTYRCALSVPHPHSWHVSNINRIEATWSDDAADPATPTEPRVWQDIHEQDWTEQPDGLFLTYQGMAFSRSQLEELVGPLTEVVEDA